MFKKFAIYNPSKICFQVHAVGLSKLSWLYRVEWGKPLGRCRRRWENNMRMDVRGRGWESMCWIHLAQNTDQWRAAVITVMNLRFPRQAAEKFLSS